jgi:hypothetical protein
MKLHFEPDLDYQLQAIEGVCELIRELKRAEASRAAALALL